MGVFILGEFGRNLVCSSRQLAASARVAASSSRKAVNFSFARTIKRFPLSRCASAIQIVRPQESTAETQPKLQPALRKLSLIISHCFTNPTPLVVVLNGLRRRFAQFKLRAHVLDLRGLLLRGKDGFTQD
jgi:hypothetical protein